MTKKELQKQIGSLRIDNVALALEIIRLKKDLLGRIELLEKQLGLEFVKEEKKENFYKKVK